MKDKIKVLVVVDAQVDFIYGTLENEEAQKAVPNIVDKILAFDGDAIFLTMDTHFKEDYLKTKEGQKLPVEHCLCDENNGYGWRVASEIEDAAMEKAKQGLEIKFIPKFTFGSVEGGRIKEKLVGQWKEFFENHKSLPECIMNLKKDYSDPIPMEIEICGFISDICVLHNAIILKAFTYDFAEITVDSKCCAGSTIENHNKAMDLLKIGHINVV